MHIMQSLLLHPQPLTPPLTQRWHICLSPINLNLSPCLNTQIKNTLWFSGFPVSDGPILTGKTVYFYWCKMDRA